MRAVIVAIVAFATACAPPVERELSVAMTEHRFLPDRIEVATGERVRLVLKNIGRLEHDFATDERGRALGLAHLHLAAGQQGAHEWTAPVDPVEIRIVCTIPGHEALGMVATLSVKPRTAGSFRTP